MLPPHRYFSTPRHRAKAHLSHIPWVGCVSNPNTQALWSPEVELRIPDGSEFHNPKPPSSNHFSNLFVFHRTSKVVHNDDCICYFDSPKRKIGILLSIAKNLSHDKLDFHGSLGGVGLLPNPQAPLDFKKWIEVRTWNEMIVPTQHSGFFYGIVQPLARMYTPPIFTDRPLHFLVPTGDVR